MCSRFLVLLFTLALVLPAAAQRKLNPPLARDPGDGGHVREFTFSADGTRVLLRADQRAGIIELFSTPSDASAPAVRIHPPIAPYADVSECRLALGRAVFVGDLDVDERRELYSTPADGSGLVVRLSTPPVAGGDVQLNFQIAPDGARAIYRADQDADERFELYSVPLDGSAAALKLHPPLGPNNDVQAFAFTPDGARVVYLADQDTNLVNELYSVPVEGGSAPLKLNGPLASDGNVSDFRLGSAAGVVLFRARQAAGQVLELFHAPVDASAPAQLVSGGPSAGIGVAADYALDPSGTRAVYRISGFFAGQLFSTPLENPAPVRLNSVVSGAHVPTFAISDDGATVAFHFDLPGYDEELRAVPIDGGPSVLLHDLPHSGGLVLDFVGERVAYLRYDVDLDDDLFTVPADGSAPPLRLSGGGPAAGFIPTFRVAGDRLVFNRGAEFSAPLELFTVPADGSAAAERLNAPLASGDVGGYVVDPAAGRVAYLAAEQAYDRVDLYVRASDASTPSVRLSPALYPGPIAGDVTSAAATSDGRFCVYLATQDELQSVELFSVDLAHGSEVRRLNGPVDGGRDVRLFLITPDETSALFVGDLDPEFGEEIYVVPLDASQPPLRLAPEVGQSISHVYNWRATPDGSRLVYQAFDGLHSLPLDGSTPSVKLSHTPGGPLLASYVIAGERVVYRHSIGGGSPSLHSAPVDGSAAPVVLQGPLNTGVSTFQASSDGTCVVYRADPEAAGLFELYRVPADGSAPPAKLSPVLVSGGDVSENFAIDVASNRVAYQADQELNDVDEIFAVPLDGSGPAQKLSGTLVAGGDVELIGISPSGRVVYFGDALTNGTSELFSVPILGGSPLLISGVMPAGGDVLGDLFHFAPGGRVLYRATQSAGPPVDLFVTREDGSAAPQRLNVPLPAGASLHSVNVNGPRVQFLSNQRTPAKFELWSLSFESPRPARVVNGPLVTGGNVLSSFSAAGRVFYVADEDRDESADLYVVEESGPRHTTSHAPSVLRGASSP